MVNAVYDTMSVEVTVADKYLFRASGSRVRFPGFLAVYEEAREEDAVPDEEAGKLLPDLDVGEVVDLVKLMPEQHCTQPPPRYTEATLIRALEEYGIGRPSTYAPIISTIQDRGYVIKRARQLTPTDLGLLVNDKLVPFFEDIINTRFTARIEEELDLIEESEKDWIATLREFYDPFVIDLQKAENEMTSEKGKEVAEKCPKCGEPIVERWSRFGKFLSCSSYPKCE